MDYQFILSDHGMMHPDFFQGTKGVQLNIYPLRHHTKIEVLEMLRIELDVYYDSLYTLFEARDKPIPSDIEEKLELMFSEIKEKINPEATFSREAPTEEDVESEEEGEFPPFIFSIDVDFFE